MVNQCPIPQDYRKPLKLLTSTMNTVLIQVKERRYFDLIILIIFKFYNKSFSYLYTFLQQPWKVNPKLRAQIMRFQYILIFLVYSHWNASLKLYHERDSSNCSSISTTDSGFSVKMGLLTKVG